jgi:putative hydrolase of the HAD superfamily
LACGSKVLPIFLYQVLPLRRQNLVQKQEEYRLYKAFWSDGPREAIMTAAYDRPFDAIVFDLGGVLIELGGVPRMLELLDHRVTVDELWTRWLSSPSVRQFETGRMDADQFALRLLAEFELSISPGQFIAEFTAWPKGLFPGTIELLQALAPRYTLACLTNTNALHWPHICDVLGLRPHFTLQFASHLLGILKPDRAIFQHAIDHLGCLPERILFLDDTAVNVESARSVGISAYRAVGLAGAVEQLGALKVLPLP